MSTISQGTNDENGVETGQEQKHMIQAQSKITKVRRNLWTSTDPGNSVKLFWKPNN